MPDEMNSNELQNLWQSQSTEGFQMSTEEIRRRIQALNKSIRARNYAGFASCAVVMIACLNWLTFVPTLTERIGALMTIGGVAFMFLQIYRNNIETRVRRATVGATASMDFYRSELAHQRDFHRGTQLWSRILLFVPGPLVFMIGVAVARPDLRTILLIDIAIFIFVVIQGAPRNLKRANRYQQQLDELDRLQGVR